MILREDEASNVSVKSLLNHAVLSNQQLQNRITQLEEENLRLVQERMLVLKRLEECVNIKEQVYIHTLLLHISLTSNIIIGGV